MGNKSAGEAFLLVWRLPDDTDRRLSTASRRLDLPSRATTPVELKQKPSLPSVVGSTNPRHRSSPSPKPGSKRTSGVTRINVLESKMVGDSKLDLEVEEGVEVVQRNSDNALFSYLKMIVD